MYSPRMSDARSVSAGVQSTSSVQTSTPTSTAATATPATPNVSPTPTAAKPKTFMDSQSIGLAVFMVLLFLLIIACLVIMIITYTRVQQLVVAGVNISGTINQQTADTGTAGTNNTPVVSIAADAVPSQSVNVASVAKDARPSVPDGIPLPKQTIAPLVVVGKAELEPIDPGQLPPTPTDPSYSRYIVLLRRDTVQQTAKQTLAAAKVAHVQELVDAYQLSIDHLYDHLDFHGFSTIVTTAIADRLSRDPNVIEVHRDVTVLHCTRATSPPSLLDRLRQVTGQDTPKPVASQDARPASKPKTVSAPVPTKPPASVQRQAIADPQKNVSWWDKLLDRKPDIAAEAAKNAEQAAKRVEDARRAKAQQDKQIERQRQQKKQEQKKQLVRNPAVARPPPPSSATASSTTVSGPSPPPVTPDVVARLRSLFAPKKETIAKPVAKPPTVVKETTEPPLDRSEQKSRDMGHYEQRLDAEKNIDLVRQAQRVASAPRSDPNVDAATTATSAPPPPPQMARFGAGMTSSDMALAIAMGRHSTAAPASVQPPTSTVSNLEAEPRPLRPRTTKSNVGSIETAVISAGVNAVAHLLETWPSSHRPTPAESIVRTVIDLAGASFTTSILTPKRDANVPFRPSSLSTTDKSGGLLVPPLPWNVTRLCGCCTSLSNCTNYTPSQRIPNVEVFVLDTGIDFLNPNLYIVDRRSYVPWELPTYDYNGHGTHVAGTAVGIGVGIAQGARMHAVKVLDRTGAGTFATVMAGINYAISQKMARSTTPMVLNLSFAIDTGTSVLSLLDRAVQSAVAAGIVVCCAIGNSGTVMTNVSPSHTPGVNAIFAYDQNNTRPSWSNYDPTALGAPGVGVRSFLPGNVLGTLDGSSMACASATGTFALYLSAHPRATPAQARAAIIDAANLAGVGANPQITNIPDGASVLSLYDAGLA